MLYVVVLAFGLLSIALAVYGLARQYVGEVYYPEDPSAPRPAPRDTAPAQVSPSAPADPEPATLTDFDTEAEVVVVQLPSGEAGTSRAEDFSCRAAPDGVGQHVLFRDRVLLHLPDVPVGRRIALYVEPAAG